MSSTTLRAAEIRGRAEAAIFTDSCRCATAAMFSSESARPLNSMCSILATTSPNESGWRLSFVLALGLRLGRWRRLGLKQLCFLEVFFPSRDPGSRASTNVAEEAMASGFVLGVVLDLAPKQTSAASPAIKHNSVDERLISCGHNQRVIFIRFLCPRRAPMKHE